jgi:hypothetical protein
MESSFGADFSHVRVHRDERAAQSAEAVNALAYTVGRDVVFGAGQYAPETVKGRSLLAHELTHVVQQGDSTSSHGKLEIGAEDSPFEREADQIATAVLNQQPVTQNFHANTHAQRSPAGVIRRVAIHTGRILDEGSCEHLACNSKWACQDDANGITCPEGTRNADPVKKFRPLFTCDTNCENGATCSDTDTWMAIPKSRFARRKCGQDLVICANGRFTHAQVRDRSEREAWEVGHGIQDALGVSPYSSFRGSIYANESDAAFKTDSRCRPAAPPTGGTGTSTATESGTETSTSTEGGSSGDLSEQPEE